MLKPLDSDLFAGCPSRPPLFRVGGKWTAMILVCLRDGPRRFTEMQAVLPGITPKVLTESLRAMENDALLTRKAYPENPPRVQYSLTPLGHTLFKPLAAACEWNSMYLRSTKD
ncbi:winged helix-turn-helix transcriptional regulator [Streptosporangium amethystogenes]|uniref:winged helix-turn-helix transcriptional regulator n=1 Tax=Streptosporangium amethystogenes TaxID=2002 RepID=UPI0037A55346